MNDEVFTLEQEETKRPVTMAEKIEYAHRVLLLGAKMSMDFYGEPLMVAYSGGKDSDVLLRLAEECLKPCEFEVENSHTSVDAPQTVYHIREEFERLNRSGIHASTIIPRYSGGGQKTMWNLTRQKLMLPTRLVRFCCAELKETTTPNRLVAVGVREDESSGRKGRDAFQTWGGQERKRANGLFFA